MLEVCLAWLVVMIGENCLISERWQLASKLGGNLKVEPFNLHEEQGRHYKLLILNWIALHYVLTVLHLEMY